MRLPEHGRMVSCKMKGRQMWCPVPIPAHASYTTLRGHLTSLDPTFLICRRLTLMLPPGGGVVVFNEKMFTELLAALGL